MFCGGFGFSCPKWLSDWVPERLVIRSSSSSSSFEEDSACAIEGSFFLYCYIFPSSHSCYHCSFLSHQTKWGRIKFSWEFVLFPLMHQHQIANFNVRNFCFWTLVSIFFHLEPRLFIILLHFESDLRLVDHRWNLRKLCLNFSTKELFCWSISCGHVWGCSVIEYKLI